MKKQSLWARLKVILCIAYRFGQQHASSIDAMKEMYFCDFFNQSGSEKYNSATLKIAPHGSVYKVTQQLYLDNEIIEERSWLATYGWHSNGHLIEIGGHRYCIFNPIDKTLYLEGYNDADFKTIETYTKI